MRRYSLLRIIPLLAVALLTACGGADSTGSAESEGSQKARVRVQPVQIVPVDQNASFTATVEADKVNNIAPAMGGRIRKIYVDVGDYVRQGQAVVAMDAATFSQQ